MVLQLAPLQSGLTATLRTTFLICVILAVLSPSLVHATDVTQFATGNQSELTFGDDGQRFQSPIDTFNGLDLQDDSHEGLDTLSLDIVRRAPAGVWALGNNQFQQRGIRIGETQYWYFPKEEVNSPKSNVTSGLLKGILGKSASQSNTSSNALGKRSTTVYLSLTTCQKPGVNTTSKETIPDLPQLEVYVSLSESLQKPGPGKNGSAQTAHRAHKGYMGTTVEADGDVFVSVMAPNTTAYAGIYTYQMAASIDALFHSVNDNGPNLYFVDADINAALLVTNNLTQATPGSDNYNQWMNITPPYTVFANNVNDTSLIGLERSYCALEENAQIGKISSNVEASMTSRGLGNKPKEQFYITGLNRSSIYHGILAVDGNSTDSGNGIVGGGGKVWRPMNFTTKTDENCAVLFNLPFCSEVAYAVPSNPSLDVSRLSSIYDSHASSLYTNFTNSLQQIQCNTSAESMFSLAVNCTDCEHAYKQWLCGVTIPRCADFSSNDTFLQIRNAGQPFLNGSSIPKDSPLRTLPATNSSRNPVIDAQIRPGPYKEILPCQDVCYSLVKSCPSALQFSCPQGRQLNWSYGIRDDSGIITCSYLGAAYYLNDGWSLSARVGSAVYMLGLFWGFFWFMDVSL